MKKLMLFLILIFGVVVSSQAALKVTAAKVLVTVKEFPVEVSAEPGGTIYDFEVPPGFKTTRKINHTLIITEAPNGTHKVSVSIFTSPKAGKKAKLVEEETTLIIDVVPKK